MPGYKDDLNAAHARIAALEREVAELRGGDREAASPEPEEAPYVRPRPIGSVVSLSLILLPFLLAAGYFYRHPGAWVMLGMGAIALLLLLVAVQALVELVRPCELLVLSGRRHKLADGSVVGHRVLFGGRVLRVPLIERADRMDLRAHRTSWSISHSYCEGGIPVFLAGYQLIAVSTDPATARNAVERFLGRDAEEVLRVANETLEGQIRSVVAETPFEDLERRRDKLTRLVHDAASSEIKKLGLDLLALGILEVRNEAVR